MKINEFEVLGLFGLYNHRLKFDKTTHSSSLSEGASVIMMYGQNGIGKTTILRMIEGLMSLDFNVFRTTKFQKASLTFSNRHKITVEGIYNEKRLEYLQVIYRDLIIKLNPKEKGVLSDKDADKEATFGKQYNDDLDNFSFEFIDTQRLMRKTLKEQLTLEELTNKGKVFKKTGTSQNAYLLGKVKDFIGDSQVNHSRYFQKTEPALFDIILSNLENDHKVSTKDLIGRLDKLLENEKKSQLDRFGLAKEKWNKKRLTEAIESSKKDQSKLKIISSYIEVIESRNKEVIDVAERLLKFESIINDFLSDKTIKINESGFELQTKNKDILNEGQLSTGEYHLLYLSVLALCTKVKGTVIAIDEPEMSMHIKWQNKLVNALVEISSKASPQIIFATHSPDIAKNYPNSLITL